jgi:hypothetical protein
VESRNNNVAGDRSSEQPHPFLLPNKYDEKRAHLAVFNWKNEPEVRVPGGGFLKDGERYQLRDPLDFWGKPVSVGACKGDGFTVRMKDEFGVFVLLKD